MSPTDARVIVVTGGTGGLGLATAQALVEDSTQADGGSNVLILTARSVEKGRQAAGFADVEKLAEDKGGWEVVVMALQLDEEASVQAFKDEVEDRYGRIDVLVSNAAAHLDFSIDEKTLTTAQAFTRTLHTNITATHTLLTILLPLLFVPTQSPSSRRIIVISSGIASLADHSDTRISINQPPAAGYPKQPSFNILTYRTSKTGLNMLALEWARILREDAFKLHILDPGLLATSLGGADPVKIKSMGAEEPIVGARFVSDVVGGKWDEKVEVLLNRHGVVPW